MTVENLTQTQVGEALRRLGNYRVRRTQTVALEGAPDGISGSLVLALGLRETRLRNVNGGARLERGVWVPSKDDRGVFQIASKYHAAELARMPGVAEGTWAPVIAGKSPADERYCPRFEDSLRFTLAAMHEAQALAEDHDVPVDERARFAVAAHNAGAGGALEGWLNGDVDENTTHGDYSAWVGHHAGIIRAWLREHDGWRIPG